jgi:hypothetical protein
MTNHAADAARCAAAVLAPSLNPNLPAEVEARLAALYSREPRPGQYDAVAIAGLGIGAASLIVTVAQLAWSIASDRREHASPPPADVIARQVRITLRERDLLLPAEADRITDVVITEITRRAGPPQ